MRREVEMNKSEKLKSFLENIQTSDKKVDVPELVKFVDSRIKNIMGSIELENNFTELGCEIKVDGAHDLYIMPMHILPEKVYQEIYDNDLVHLEKIIQMLQHIEPTYTFGDI